MPGFLRSLSQRFRSGRGRQTRLNDNHRVEGSLDQSRSQQQQRMSQQPKFDSRRECICKVLLLDGTSTSVVVSRKGFGQEVYDHVFNLLDLEERDYFGLQFADHYHVQHWLDPLKKLAKQVVIGPPYTFRFKIKFYSSEPMNLREEVTRYQFFLQLKQDIQSGKLDCPKPIAVELAAYALQSEFGDYNAREHNVVFVSEFRFHPQQDEEMEAAILEKYKTVGGQSPAVAEMNYLNVAKWIEYYGVDLHIVEGKDGNEYRLGISPSGLLVFDGNQKIGLFAWNKIQNLDFRYKKLTLIVEEDASNGHIQLHTFVFELSSHKACKHLWKCAVEHHTFFRLKFHKPSKQSKVQLFRLGSTFKYRGRTEYENVHRECKLARRSGNTFERRPSQRYVPRQSYFDKQKYRQDVRQQQLAAAAAAAANNNSIQGAGDAGAPATAANGTKTDAPRTSALNDVSKFNTVRTSAGSTTVIGAQKPSKTTTSFSAQTGSHVTTIEIGEKGANVFADGKTASAPSQSFFDKNYSSVFACQSDKRIHPDTRSKGLPIVSAEKNASLATAASRMVTEL